MWSQELEPMGFKDTVAYRVYPIYNWMGIHFAPCLVLDAFVPFLCHVNKHWVIKTVKHYLRLN